MEGLLGKPARVAGRDLVFLGSVVQSGRSWFFFHEGERTAVFVLAPVGSARGVAEGARLVVQSFFFPERADGDEAFGARMARSLLAREEAIARSIEAAAARPFPCTVLPIEARTFEIGRFSCTLPEAGRLATFVLSERGREPIDVAQWSARFETPLADLAAEDARFLQETLLEVVAFLLAGGTLPEAVSTTGFDPAQEALDDVADLLDPGTSPAADETPRGPAVTPADVNAPLGDVMDALRERLRTGRLGWDPSRVDSLIERATASVCAPLRSRGLEWMRSSVEPEIDRASRWLRARLRPDQFAWIPSHVDSAVDRLAGASPWADRAMARLPFWSRLPDLRERFALDSSWFALMKAGVRRAGTVENRESWQLDLIERQILEQIPSASFVRLPDPDAPGMAKLIYGVDADSARELADLFLSLETQQTSLEQRRAVARIGRLLGFPACCSTAYPLLSRLEGENPGWGHLRRRCEHPGPVDPRLNPFTGMKLFHTQCRMDCPATLRQVEIASDAMRASSRFSWTERMRYLRHPVVFLLGTDPLFAVLGRTGPDRADGFPYRFLASHGTGRRFRHLEAGDYLRVLPLRLEVMKGRQVLATFDGDAAVWRADRAYHPDAWLDAFARLRDDYASHPLRHATPPDE